MNAKIKFPKILKELEDNMDVYGHPPKEDFSALCEYVTNWMIRKYDLNNDESINYGYCFIWAYLVWALWPGEGITFTTVSGHVVVKYNGNYWDSEHCEGEKDLNKFCCFNKFCTPKHVDVRWMCWYWTRAGLFKREFRRLIRSLTPETYKLVRDNGKGYWKSPDDFPGYKALKTIEEVA